MFSLESCLLTRLNACQEIFKKYSKYQRNQKKNFLSKNQKKNFIKKLKKIKKSKKKCLFLSGFIKIQKSRQLARINPPRSNRTRRLRKSIKSAKNGRNFGSSSRRRRPFFSLSNLCWKHERLSRAFCAH